MSRHRFCTYFDSRYLPKGLLLHESLLRQHPELELWVLCLDDEAHRQLTKLKLRGVHLLKLQELETADPQLAACRSNRRLVEYYFTLTPCLPLHLMRTQPRAEWTTHLDADLYFFSPLNPLFEEMDRGDVAIIPHRFSEKQKHLEIYGVFNVGWVSFRDTDAGRRCLGWWREHCIEWCRDAPEEGRFADQKYLDHFSEITPSTVMISNPGANLAPWNVGNHDLRFRNGRFTVDGRELIFYHFHDCRQTGSRKFNPGLRKYGFKISPVLREQLYPTYLRRLLKLQASGTKDTIRFKGASQAATPVPEKDLIEVPLTRRQKFMERLASLFSR